MSDNISESCLRKHILKVQKIGHRDIRT